MQKENTADVLQKIDARAECLQALCVAALDTAAYGNGGNDKEVINRLQSLIDVFADELSLIRQDIDKAS